MTDDSWAPRINSMLKELACAVPEVVEAAVVSSQGVSLTSSTWDFARDQGDHLASSACDLLGHAATVAAALGGGATNQVLIEMEHGVLLVAPITFDSSLSVLATPECDLGKLGYHMVQVADNAREVMTPDV
ncbi:roadblock/LC7 domain-containing protein [Nonomuraea sp. NPDC046802]|uniref:roadblock/LC7 domain-containing protein n=1 Tax=Nonomuraea sp. NPDC046802 TaxID=3154919 RepID=UPI0033F746B3